jgi:sugar lactone lactonase YvrE
MNSKTLAVSLAAAVLWCAASSLSAQALKNAPPPPPTATEIELSKITDVGELLQRAGKWKEGQDMRRYTYAMERLVQLRPYSPTFQYRLAEAYAMQDQKTKAYNALIKVQKQGLAINPDKDKDFDPVRNTQAFKYIIEGLETNAKPWGEGKVAITLAGAPELVESIAFDAKRNRFLVGSVRTGEILSVTKEGRVEVFASPETSPGLRSVFALAVDDERGFLWVGTAGAPQYVKHKSAELGQAALIKFDLAKGEVIEAYPVPVDGVPRNFGSIAVAANGTVYATDAIANVVYQVQDGKLRTLFGVPGSTSLRGLAVSPDEKHLYFVDYELGLRVADLAKSEIRELAKDNQNLGGIDGIYYYDGHLVAVQNGTIPTRILRIKLDTEKGVIDTVQPLEANKDALVMPTFAALDGEHLYVIANSQRDLYGADGKPFEGERAEDRALYRVSARFAWPAAEGETPRVPMLPTRPAEAPAGQ